MAFKDQVEDLTSLTVSDNDELSQFLKDGVIDVTNKWLAVRPQDVDDFTRESAEQTSNGFNPGTSKIVSVIREAGTDGEWYPCTKKPINLQYLVTNKESIHYASKYNPVFMITQNTNVHVYPVPTSAGNNGFKVLYINYDPEEDDGTDLEYNSASIKWFPSDKVYLVILYAGMKLLQATMGSKGISTLSITAVPPDTPELPTFTTVTVSATTARTLSASAPSYTAPTVGGATEELTAQMTSLTGDAMATDSDFADFSKWFVTAGELIEDEEDTELAAAHIQKINSYIQSYQAALQNQLNEFNEANVAYQGDLQEALQELQVAAGKAQKDADFAQQKTITEYANKLQRYQNEIAAYQADIASQVQEYTGNIQEATTEYQWLQSQYTMLLQEYANAFAIAAPKPAPEGR